MICIMLCRSAPHGLLTKHYLNSSSPRLGNPEPSIASARAESPSKAALLTPRAEQITCQDALQRDLDVLLVVAQVNNANESHREVLHQSRARTTVARKESSACKYHIRHA